MSDPGGSVIKSAAWSGVALRTAQISSRGIASRRPSLIFRMKRSRSRKYSACTREGGSGSCRAAARYASISSSVVPTVQLLMYLLPQGKEKLGVLGSCRQNFLDARSLCGRWNDRLLPTGEDGFLIDELNHNLNPCVEAMDMRRRVIFAVNGEADAIESKRTQAHLSTLLLQTVSNPKLYRKSSRGHATTQIPTGYGFSCIPSLPPLRSNSPWKMLSTPVYQYPSTNSSRNGTVK